MTVAGTAIQREIVELLDTLGRIMWCHKLDPAYAGVSLHLPADVARELVDGGNVLGVAAALDQQAAIRLPLLIGVLLRLEHRCGHDAAAIRGALATPLACLADRSPADLLGGSLDDLARLRQAAEQVEAPKTKWWRVGH